MSQSGEVSDEDIFDMETQRISPIIPSSQGSPSAHDDIFMQPTQPLHLETVSSDPEEGDGEHDDEIYSAATQPLFLHTLEENSDIDSEAATQPHFINETTSTEPLDRTAFDDSFPPDGTESSPHGHLHLNSSKSPDRSAGSAPVPSTSKKKEEEKTVNIHEAETQPLHFIPPSDDDDDGAAESKDEDSDIVNETVEARDSDDEGDPMSPSLFHDDSDLEDLPVPRSSSPIQPSGSTELKITRKSDQLFPRPSITWSQADTLPIDECLREECLSSDSEFEITITSQSNPGSQKFEGFSSSAAAKSSAALEKIQEAVTEDSEHEHNEGSVDDTCELHSEMEQAGPSNTTRTRTRGSHQAVQRPEQSRTSQASSNKGKAAKGRRGTKSQKVESSDAAENTTGEPASRLPPRLGRPSRGSKAVEDQDVAVSSGVSTRSTRKGRSTSVMEQAKNAVQSTETLQVAAARPKRGKTVLPKHLAVSNIDTEVSNTLTTNATSTGNPQEASEGPTGKSEVTGKEGKLTSVQKPQAAGKDSEAFRAAGILERVSETASKVPGTSGRGRKSTRQAGKDAGTDRGASVAAGNMETESGIPSKVPGTSRRGRKSTRQAGKDAATDHGASVAAGNMETESGTPSKVPGTSRRGRKSTCQAGKDAGTDPGASSTSANLEGEPSIPEKVPESSRRPRNWKFKKEPQHPEEVNGPSGTSSTAGAAEEESSTPHESSIQGKRARKTVSKVQQVRDSLQESTSRQGLSEELENTHREEAAPAQRSRTRRKATRDSSTEIESPADPGKRNRSSRAAIAETNNNPSVAAVPAAAGAEILANICSTPATRVKRGARRNSKAAQLQPADENRPSTEEDRERTTRKRNEAAEDAVNGPSPVKRERTSRSSASGHGDKDSTLPVIQRRTRRTLAGKVRVCFTGLDNDRHRHLVSTLGGEVVEESSKSSVLVTDKVRRTVKFLCAVGRGLPIVNPNWLELSSAAKKFLDPWQHLLKDPTGERKFSFKLKTTLEQAAESPVLAGWCIGATPAVLPPPSELKDVVTSAGGLFVDADAVTAEKTAIVSCTEDKDQWRKWQRRGIPVIQTEAVLSGILQHQFAPEKFKLC